MKNLIEWCGICAVMPHIQGHQTEEDRTRAHTGAHTHLDRADLPGHIPPGSLQAPCGCRNRKKRKKRAVRGEILGHNIPVLIGKGCKPLLKSCVSTHVHAVSLLCLIWSCNRCSACYHRQKKNTHIPTIHPFSGLSSE